MPYLAKAIANYFLDRGWAEGKGVDPLKLQKLVYFAHGWHLGLYDSPLLDGGVQAWRFGPVIPTLYHEFKEFGNAPIDWPARDEETRHVPRIPAHDEETRAFLDRIWSVYSDYSGLRLSDMTHKPGTPWANAWNESGRNIMIPDSEIRRYFSSLAREQNRQAEPAVRA